ncbi:MAG: hypothetical protein V4513_04005 [Pseudomonadota bacterium]
MSATLNSELAAYSPGELAELAETIGVLLEAADNGTVGYCESHARISTTLSRAIQKRLEVERDAARTATIIPFPRQ